MKVVLFCGGLGTRLREHSDTIPKPLVPVGNRPILWHLMRFYAQYGCREFVLCLGYRGDLIREWFLQYDPRLTDDFVMEGGRTRLFQQQTDVPDWQIHFVDTGQNSNIGERLLAVRHLLDDQPMFLANYSDQLSDLPLDEYVRAFERSGATAGFVAVRPSQSFHLVELADDGFVEAVRPVESAPVWINGGFLTLRQEIFDAIEPGEELVEEPFSRLVAQRKLFGYRYTGFWKAMDTLKDKLSYDELHSSGIRPWEVWRNGSAAAPRGTITPVSREPSSSSR